VARLGVDDRSKTILNHPGWQSFHAMPVVDEAGALVGVIRYETMRRLASDTSAERQPELMVFGATLGQIWVTLATTMLDGFAATLREPRSERRHRTEEANDGE
jgi:hypothetical protein